MSNDAGHLTVVSLENLGDDVLEALVRDSDGYEYRARASRAEIEALAAPARKARLIQLTVEQNTLPRQVGPEDLNSLLGS